MIHLPHDLDHLVNFLMVLAIVLAEQEHLLAMIVAGHAGVVKAGAHVHSRRSR